MVVVGVGVVVGVAVAVAVGVVVRCWVLGNGPTLPVDDLHLLADEPTIGVNHILRSGFTPRCVLWADKGQRWHGVEDPPGGVLTVGPRLRYPTVMSHVELPVVSARRVVEHWRSDHLLLHGSSGGAAVRWAYTLGFRDIVCLGMGGVEIEGVSNFYGHVPNRRFPEQRGRYKAYRNDRRLLESQIGDHVQWTDNIRSVL